MFQPIEIDHFQGDIWLLLVHKGAGIQNLRDDHSASFRSAVSKHL